MLRRGGRFGSVAKRAWCLVLLGVVLLAGAGVLLWHLQAHGMAVRLIAAERLADVAVRPSEVRDSDLVAREFSGRDPVELLRAVMNGVTRVGPDPPGGVRQILEHAQAGGGLVCFGMAHLYAAAARGNGLQARIIGLSRNLGDRYDAHTTVEVRQEGRWVLFDPTFNVSFARNGILLGAEEIQQALLEGTFQTIVPVFYGPVKYPARLETYYLHWLPLFNNVFVLDAGGIRLAKFPPIRYWLGPRIYVRTVAGHPNEHIRFWDGLYLWSAVILPFLGLAFLALGGLGLCVRRKATRLDSLSPTDDGLPAVPMRNSGLRSLAISCIVGLVRATRGLPLIGQAPAEKGLSATARAGEPFWQTLLEMKTDNNRRFFGLFGLDESIVDGKTVLDLGCGYGGNVLAWADRHPSASFVGLEPFPHVMQIAERAAISFGVRNTRFVTGLGEALPFRDNSFDVIVTWDVIEHVRDPMRVMQEIARCLKAGGVSLGIFPPYYNPTEHHLGYATRLPFLHLVFSPEVLVAAVNRLIDAGEVEVTPQPAPQRGPWGRKTLPSLNGTTVADWNRLTRQLQSRYAVTVRNTYAPFGERFAVLRTLSRIMLRVFRYSDLFCGRIRTMLRKEA
jgi:SAM-dependent methyltransferase